MVVFAHGFSQRPDNYASTLLRLAEEGYVIVAPRVWFASVIAPWARVETQGVFAPLPRKLQTALLIDVARCVQIATDGGAKAVHLLGHSMGAAMMLAYARFPPRGVLESVALLAPAVKDSSVSELNPYVTIGEGGDVSGIEKLAKEIEDVRIIALQGKRDGIVDADDTGLVMAALKNREALTGLLYLEDGTHVGFEDQLDVRLNLPFLVLLERFVFRILDFLIYVVNVFDIDAEEQQVLTKLVLERWLVFDHMNDGKTIVDSVMDRNKDASTDLLKRVSNAIQQFTW